MLRAEDMEDRYREGSLVRRWSIVAGQPRCVLAPLDVAVATDAEIAAAETGNALARAAIAALDAYEAALEIASQPEPPEYLPGEDAPVNPAHAAWLVAVATVGAASAETLALHAARQAGPRGEARILAELDAEGAITALIVTDDPLAEGEPVPAEARLGGTLVGGVYSPPAPRVVVPNEVGYWQFMAAAARFGFITPEEAQAAVQHRTMPAVITDVLAALPPEQRAEAEIKLAGITSMVRADPLFDLLVQVGPYTAEQVDAVFLAAQEVV